MNLGKLEHVISLEKQRLETIDLLRGVAVLGMLFVNILTFLPDFRFHLLDISEGGQSSLNGNILELIFVLFNGKMRAMFAILFGAGIVLYFGSPARFMEDKSTVFARRMVFLLLFGLVHAYLLLWPGTILFEYALCGLLLFSFRGLSISSLIIMSLLTLSVYFYHNSKDFRETYEIYLSYQQAIKSEQENITLTAEQISDKKEFEEILEYYPPFSDSEKESIKKNMEGNKTLYLSGFKEIYKHNTKVSNEYLSFGVYMNILESLGTMLLGMALVKIGFFHLELKKSTYFLIAVFGCLFGAIIYALLFKWQNCTKSELIDLYSWKTFSSFTLEGVARLAQAVGYCSAFILVSQVRVLRGFVLLIEGVGKMALTWYIFQTSILAIFFYGLSFYGRFEMLGFMILVLCLVIFQLAAAFLWLKFFKTGPFEYFWRRLTVIGKDVF